MKNIKRILVGSFVLGMVMGSEATPVVGFGGASTVNSRAADSSTLGGDMWNFSDTTTLINSGGGANDIVYGGMNTGWSVDMDYAPRLRWLTTSGFQIQVNPANGSDTSAKGLVLWNQTDFLNGADAQTVTFAAGDSLSVNMTGITATTRELRFALKQNGIYYVSNVKKTDAVLGTFSIDPATISWRTVSMDGNYTVSSTGAVIPLDNVEAVGLFMDYTRAANQVIVKFDDFQADATVIPEAATMALVGITSLGFLVLRRLFFI